jgi:hypothetical protein
MDTVVFYKRKKGKVLYAREEWDVDGKDAWQVTNERSKERSYLGVSSQAVHVARQRERNAAKGRRYRREQG